MGRGINKADCFQCFFGDLADFIFCFFMFGFYALLLFKENRKNYLYWITIAALSVYPRFSMGLYNDFTMRTSIPALFVLMILILHFHFLAVVRFPYLSHSFVLSHNRNINIRSQFRNWSFFRSVEIGFKSERLSQCIST